MLIDSHIHLDAAEFAADREALIERARAAGVRGFVVPGVERAGFGDVLALAAARRDVCPALGVHPLYVARATMADLEVLDAHLAAGDAHAVGEIGLDHFVTDVDPARQLEFFRAQLRLARKHGLPVILHVRRAVDPILRELRRAQVCGGIAHAFNGSRQQADMFLDMGFRLGFGGAVTYERATRLRALAAQLPAEAIVMETDAPDIPPHWLYATAEQRAAGQGQGRNEPGELPRIGAEVAQLRGVPPAAWAATTTGNALAALPGLQRLVRGP